MPTFMNGEILTITTRDYWDVRGNREWQEFTQGIKPRFSYS